MEKYHVSRGPHSVPISHAAECIYTQGSVIFWSFLRGPKTKTFMILTPKSSPESRFFRGCVKTSKNTIPVYRCPKIHHFFAKKFYIHFSGNPANVTEMSIFEGSKTLQKVMKIMRFELLSGPFVHLGWVLGRVPKIMQNWPQNLCKFSLIFQELHETLAEARFFRYQ